MSLKAFLRGLFHSPIALIAGTLAGGIAMFLFILAVVTLQHSPPQTGNVVDAKSGLESKNRNAPDVRESPAKDQEFLAVLSLDQSAPSFNSKTRLYSFLLRSDPSSVQQFLSQVQSIPHSTWKEIVESALVQRLSVTHPDQALKYAQSVDNQRRQDLIRIVFHEWTLGNLDEAIKTGIKLNADDQKVALDSILNAGAYLPNNVYLDIARKFGGEPLAQRLIDKREALAQVSNPDQALKILLGDGTDLPSRLDELIDVSHVWVDAHGIESFLEMLDSQPELKESPVLARILVKAIARANPKQLFEQIDSNSELQQHRETIFSIWVESDPTGSMEYVANMDDPEIKDYWVWLHTVFWSEVSPREAIRQRSLYPKEMEPRLVASAIRQIAMKAPQDAIDLIERLKSEGLDSWELTDALVATWSQTDANATLEWLLSEENDEIPRFSILLESTLANLALADPQRAIDLALNPLDDRWPERLDMAVITSVAFADPIAATRLLPSVSPESRLNAYQRVGTRLINSGKSGLALDLAKKIDSTLQEDYYRSIFRSWANNLPIELFEELDGLPSSDLQAVAAYNLLAISNNPPKISMKRLEKAKDYLNEEYAAKLR